MKRLFAIVLAFSFPGAAAAGKAELLSFLQHEGCTVGPAVIEKAKARGFSQDALNRLAQEALDEGQAKQEGGWVILDRSLCEMKLPIIQSDYSIGDAVFAPYIAVEDPEGDGAQQGCYLNDAIKALEAIPGMSADDAGDAHLKLLGSGLVSGQLSMFENTPLRAPHGFTVIHNEDCAALPAARDVREGFTVKQKHFDWFVRYLFENAKCGGHGTESLHAQWEIGDDNKNAWLFLEYEMIVRAAGWYEGTSAPYMGDSRPPLCHYPKTG